MAKKSTHVVPNEKGWAIKQSNSKRASAILNTKKEAIDHARQISINQQTELIIHNLDGKISECDSHGNDPKTSKG